MTGRNSVDIQAKARDDISEELSVGFRPHPEVDESSNELVKNTSIGYLSDTNNRQKRQKNIEHSRALHPQTANSPHSQRGTASNPRTRQTL